MGPSPLVVHAQELLRGLPESQPCVYFLRQHSGMLYIGTTTDLLQRMQDHASGRACQTTQSDPPVSLLGIELYPTFCDARRREAQLKRWSRAKKEALVRGDFSRLRLLAASREAKTESIEHHPCGVGAAADGRIS